MYIHTHTHTPLHSPTHTNTHTRTHTHTSVRAHTHTHTHTSRVPLDTWVSNKSVSPHINWQLYSFTGLQVYRFTGFCFQKSPTTMFWTKEPHNNRALLTKDILWQESPTTTRTHFGFCPQQGCFTKRDPIMDSASFTSSLSQLGPGVTCQRDFWHIHTHKTNQSGPFVTCDVKCHVTCLREVSLVRYLKNLRPKP